MNSRKHMKICMILFPNSQQLTWRQRLSRQCLYWSEWWNYKMWSCERIPSYQSFITSICLFGILTSRRIPYASSKCSSCVILYCAVVVGYDQSIDIPWCLGDVRLFTICSIRYNDVIISTMASQITSLTIVYSAFYSGTDERKHQSSASLAFVRGIHRWPVNSPYKGPVMWKMIPFDDVIMLVEHCNQPPRYIQQYTICHVVDWVKVVVTPGGSIALDQYWLKLWLVAWRFKTIT